MKKSLLIVAVLLQLSFPLFGQYNNRIITHKEMNGSDKSGSTDKGIYFRIGLGYAFPQAGQTVDPANGFYNGTQTSSNDSQISFSEKKASFASGLFGYLGVGYMFNKNIGLELTGHFGLANTKYVSLSNNISTTNQENSTVTQHANFPILLNPSIVLTTSNENLNMYTRLGIAIPFSAQIIDEEENVYPHTGASSRVEDLTISIKPRISVGLTGALGISYKVGRQRVFVELNALSMSLYTREETLTAYNINGSSVLSLIPNKTLPYSFSGNPNLVNAAYSMPFSNVGIAVGFCYDLDR